MREIVMLKEECVCQSAEMQTNKLRSPRLLAYVKWIFQNNSEVVFI